MINCFFALIEERKKKLVRKIPLENSVTTKIREIFVTNGENFFKDAIEEKLFTGEELIAIEGLIFYIKQEKEMEAIFKNIPGNSTIIPTINLKEDHIKALFWYENGSCYFQNFDNRRLLKNKNIFVRLSSKKGFSLIEEGAFVVDDTISLVSKNERLYFKSYSSANKIFSLAKYYKEATPQEVISFCKNNKIAADEKWLNEKSNSILRRHITHIMNNNVLNEMDMDSIEEKARNFNVDIKLESGKLVLPNDKKECKTILSFIDEEYYEGVISGLRYKASSKRKLEPESSGSEVGK